MTSFLDQLPQTADELVQKSLTDVQRELEKVQNPNKPNAFLIANWLKAIPTAGGNRAFDSVEQLKLAIENNMPDTARDEFLDRWATIFIGDRNPAVGATGNVAATGAAASIIDTSATYQLSGVEYAVTTTSTISDQVLTVASITRIGNLATVITDGNHLLGSNIEVTIAGADQTEYNGPQTIQVTAANAFTFSVAGSPTTPATGTITALFTSASVPVQAVVPIDEDDPFGQATNQLLDAPLTLTATIAGVDSVANVDFNELAGGTDLEDDVSYRLRFLDRLQNPVSHYAPTDIRQKILDDVPGVTRVFIQKSGESIGTQSITSIDRFDVFAKVVTASDHGLFDGAQVTATGADQSDYNVTNASVLVIDTTTFCYIVTGSPITPATGTITVSVLIPLGFVQTFFVRDLDDDIIPTAPEIEDVNDAILEITPANTPDSFVITAAPTPLPQFFTFTELVPNTSTIRDAVTANLEQFFAEETTVGVNVDEDAYRSAIFNTVDPVTGDSVTSFEITLVGDIVVGIGELTTFSGASYP